MPRLGTRKLYKRLQENFVQDGIKIGRDKLFAILRTHGMLAQKRRHYVKTTNSKHWLRKYPNLLRGYEITRPDQVWVSDITYVRTEAGFCYLSLVTDAYSRKIMGSCVNESLGAEGCLSALKEALANRVELSGLIHHSDRGLQYCSREYVALLEQNNIQVSMTEGGDPYENPLAERMNRTLKEEFFGEIRFRDVEIVRKVAKESIAIYNTERPHLSLSMKTPDEVHR